MIDISQKNLLLLQLICEQLHPQDNIISLILKSSAEETTQILFEHDALVSKL